MPLKGGYSQETIAANIEELMRSWKETGKIGSSRPKTKRQAMKQAAAIAYSQAREAAAKAGKSAVAEALERGGK